MDNVERIVGHVEFAEAMLVVGKVDVRGSRINTSRILNTGYNGRKMGR